MLDVIGWRLSNGRVPDPRMELRQRILELYLAMHRKEREPNLYDIKEIAWILRELERNGLLDITPQQPNSGIFGKISRELGVTPGMLWLAAVLLAILGGKPFFEFLTGVLALWR